MQPQGPNPPPRRLIAAELVMVGCAVLGLAVMATIGLIIYERVPFTPERRQLFRSRMEAERQQKREQQEALPWR
ncbi:hypothetical protein [Cyanobium sp. NIES-981]|uniref:hypothetical protein n=1 Tax=Cyanobium sp. NIES-981 TaxID=1851505 RepID=UPI0007DE3254|nr:hypothetical protein [Cyanobium sp. NIES-981]SBO42082.1 protein of unknown function [Cyanobium sp. NIES-981]